MLLVLKMEEETMSQGIRVDGKGKKMDSPLDVPEGSG